jgi:maltose-binding protein MalE
VDLYEDAAIVESDVLSGFLEQLMVGTPAPTTRAMGMVYDPLVTAFENVYAGEMAADEALRLADEVLEADLEAAS